MQETVQGRAPAGCLTLLDEMHANIRAEYPPGALCRLNADPDLCRRFDATEARIEELAVVPGGPIEADFRAAVEAHSAVWREIIARYRAQRDAVTEQADPMPELPGDTVGAVGFSYGDGEPGMWDMARRAR